MKADPTDMGPEATPEGTSVRRTGVRKTPAGILVNVEGFIAFMVTWESF
jgi:hypothetical protein